MSVVRDLILQADDDLRYPTSGELRTMVDFLDQGAMRVSVVKVLTENEKKDRRRIRQATVWSQT